METQKYTREDLIHLCKTQPEAAADLILLLLDRVDKLEARVIELENALNKNSQNSHKPPSSDGYRLASGIYFYQLKAGNDFTDIRKMILLR